MKITHTHNIEGPKNLDNLILLRTLQSFHARYELEIVEAARAEGKTWEQIGEALGMTKQAAHSRFSPKVNPISEAITGE